MRRISRVATITSLGFTIFSKWVGTGVREAHDSLDKLDKRLRDTNQSFLAATGRVNGLIVAAVALAPALIPIGAAATAAGAAVVSSMTIAGAAAGAYGMVLKGTVTRVMELRKEGAALNADQQGYIDTLDRMKDAWTEIGRASCR